MLKKQTSRTASQQTWEEQTISSNTVKSVYKDVIDTLVIDTITRNSRACEVTFLHYKTDPWH